MALVFNEIIVITKKIDAFFVCSLSMILGHISFLGSVNSKSSSCNPKSACRQLHSIHQILTLINRKLKMFTQNLHEGIINN